MALNEIYKDGNELVFPVASTVNSGDLVQVGQIVGIAQRDAAVGEDGNYYTTLKLNGVVALTTSVAITVGAAVYVTSAGVINVTASGNKFIGHAIAAKTGTSAGTVYVRLVPSAA
jgi:predicted RecA/RadA family phage recombinase